MLSTNFLLAIALATISFLFFACSSDNTVTYGGQTYKTVNIGEQIWFAENLNYEAKGSVCYENDHGYCVKYGRLYNWRTAINVCPKGWHLPNNADWDKLYRFIDGGKGSESPYKSPIAGKYLKAASGWNDDGEGTDTYGFSALPGGYGRSNGRFYGVGYRSNWWSASDGGSNLAYSRYMSYSSGHAYWYHGDKSILSSVRCIRD